MDYSRLVMILDYFTILSFTLQSPLLAFEKTLQSLVLALMKTLQSLILVAIQSLRILNHLWDHSELYFRFEEYLYRIANFLPANHSLLVYCPSIIPHQNFPLKCD